MGILPKRVETVVSHAAEKLADTAADTRAAMIGLAVLGVAAFGVAVIALVLAARRD